MRTDQFEAERVSEWAINESTLVISFHFVCVNIFLFSSFFFNLIRNGEAVTEKKRNIIRIIESVARAKQRELKRRSEKEEKRKSERVCIPLFLHRIHHGNQCELNSRSEWCRGRSNIYKITKKKKEVKKKTSRNSCCVFFIFLLSYFFFFLFHKNKKKREKYSRTIQISFAFLFHCVFFSLRLYHFSLISRLFAGHLNEIFHFHLNFIFVAFFILFISLYSLSFFFSSCIFRHLYWLSVFDVIE